MSSEDPEIAAIRAARLAQLQQQGGPSASSGGGEQDAAKKQSEDQMRRDLLATVLDNGARERLARIALVRPQLSGQIEASLLRMAQTGQLRGRVTEEDLIGLLERAEEASGKGSQKKGTIVYQRRKELDDDDDFDF